MAIEKLSVILEMVTGNYNREAKQAATSTGGIGNAAKSVTGQLGIMIGPAAIGGAIVGLGNLALKAGENADRLFDLAAQTGLSTDALQEWEFVAAAAGAKTEVFSDAVKAVIKGLSEAAVGTGAASKAYDILGIAVLGAGGKLRDAGSITDEVFEKLSGMTNITERNALAQDIFGKKWEETISILDLGSEALGNLRKESKQAVVSPEALRNADKFRETMDKLKAVLGAQLNRAIGAIAPLLTDVAEAAKEIMDELEPMLEGLGWLSERFGDVKAKGEEMAGSNNIIEAGWGRMIGELGILNILTGNYGDVIEGAITPSEDLAAATTEVHDSWTIAAVKAAALAGAIGPTITMLDRQATSHRNVATAATTQRTALINLFTAQADLLDPVRSVLLLTKERIEAERRLVEVEADSKASAEDLALAVIEAEQAHLRLNSASAALSADQIQAFSQLLVRELGYSEEAALDLLVALGLVDGFEVNVRVNFEVANKSILDAITSRGGTSGISNTDIQVRHGGGVVGGPWGSEQLVLAQGGEGIIPLSHMRGSNTTNSRANNFYFGARGPDRPVDLQWISLLGNHQTFGKFS